MWSIRENEKNITKLKFVKTNPWQSCTDFLDPQSAINAQQNISYTDVGKKEITSIFSVSSVCGSSSLYSINDENYAKIDSVRREPNIGHSRGVISDVLSARRGFKSHQWCRVWGNSKHSSSFISLLSSLLPILQQRVPLTTTVTEFILQLL